MPGNPYGLVVTDSDEHDEEGHITEDVDYIRPEMVKKRNRKTAGLLKEMSAPIKYGPRKPKTYSLAGVQVMARLKKRWIS